MSETTRRLREWADQWPEDSDDFETPTRLYEGADALERAEQRIAELGREREDTLKAVVWCYGQISDPAGVLEPDCVLWALAAARAAGEDKP